MNSDTPKNLRDKPIDSVLQYVNETAENVPSARVRLNYTKMLYDVLGFDLTTEAALATVSEPPAELIISTAGSGKTTWSQIKAVEQKLVRKSKKGNGKRISGCQVLCLVYNEHNVADMRRKHAQMVGKLSAAGIKGLTLDESINATTMHSFCEFFRKRFIAKINLVGYTLASEVEADNLMRRAAVIEYKLLSRNDLNNIPFVKLRALYVLIKEKLCSIHECDQTDMYSDVVAYGLEEEDIEKIFNRYETIKAKSRKYEFIDMLYKVYELLKRDKDALDDVQQYYEYVIADEVQDFTPLMWEILRLFVSDGTPLTCIGDEDQNLYSFRGADLNAVLHFHEWFPGSKIYTLSENRRCSAAVLQEAKRVISENTLRFNKEIIGKKTGGKIKTVAYNTLEGQVLKLVDSIKALPIEEQNSTVVCYREAKCSFLASEILADAGISINCLRSSRPYTHELYQHVIGIYRALELPMDRGVYKNLWKVLPCKKTEFFAAIEYDPMTNRFSSSDEKIHFAKFNYGRIMQYSQFGEVIDILKRLSDKIDTMPMKESFPIVMGLLMRYFWKYRLSVSDNQELDEVFTSRVENKFTVDKTFSEVYQGICTTQTICDNDTSVGTGVTLSTFHSLKGLEFKHVFIICADNDIFPNFPLIEYKKYSPDMELQLKEAETRLWYVALTRAIDDVTIFYPQNNPSKYVRDYLDSKNAVVSRSSDTDVREVEGCGLQLGVEDEFAGEFVTAEPEVSAEPEVVSVEPEVISTMVSVASETQGNSRYLSTLFAQLG